MASGTAPGRMSEGGDVARAPAGSITTTLEAIAGATPRDDDEGPEATLATRSIRTINGRRRERAPRRSREGSSREGAETPSTSAARSSGSQSREIEPDRPRSTIEGGPAQTFLRISETTLGMAKLHQESGHVDVGACGRPDVFERD